MIKKGKTHDFEKLPQILWAATGNRIRDKESFDTIRNARNAIQHFCAPEKIDLSKTSLRFIYNVIDPLINETFGLFAIEYHEDHDIGYDYIVSQLFRQNLKFSIPPDFEVSEISIREEASSAPKAYRKWLEQELTKIGKVHYLK
jgi:hypothetical protein